MGIIDGCKASHEPERNGGKLTVRIRDEFHYGDQRGKKTGYDHTAQNQGHRCCDFGDASGIIAEDHGKHRKNEGESVSKCSAAKKNDGKTCPKTRSVGNTEKPGVDQRISKHALKRRPGNRQCGSAHCGCNRTGEPQIPDHAKLLRRDSIGKKQCVNRLNRIHGITTGKQRQCDGKQGQQY